jgi:hypothetical protein
MATSNEKQVQLKRESLLNDEVVLEDVFPKTMTDAVTDINTGTKMSEVLDTIMTVINNKLSRNVNSVNGRSGVVLLDASDVGLGNVDNVSTADLKAWVINYVASQFHDKHLILQEYYSGIQALIDTNNDVYDGVPFVCRHYTEDPNDETMAIGYMVNDGNHLTSQYYTFNFGDKGVGRFEYDSNENVLGEYFNVYDGDKRNKALGLYSTAKGYGNTTSAQSSMICGNENTIDEYGVNSFVTGNNNNVVGNKNGIVFGDANTVNDDVNGSSIIGGYGNKNIGDSGNNIVCGAENTADADTQSSIVSGRSNDVTGAYDSLIIGYENTVDHSTRGAYATTGIIVSGYGNNVSNSKTSIVSGYNNTVSDSGHGLVSGDTNKASSVHAFAAFGELNTIQNAHASMVGGYQSTVSRSQAIAWGTRVEAKGTNSAIFGTSTNGLNPETVGEHTYRYGGVQNMTVDEIINTHETTPFSIAYGTSSFVAGRDNLGIGNYSFTIGNKNVNKSPYSFVSGVNNEASANPGIFVSGIMNAITGYYSNASGIRNSVSGHNATVRGAFNLAGSYETVVGIGACRKIQTVTDINLYFNTQFNASYSLRNRLIRYADYIDIPVPLIFQPLKAKNMVFKLKYQRTNVWSDNTTTEHTISSTGDSIFEWQDDIKALRISREALNTQFGFTHSVTPGETSYDLDVLDLTDVSFEISITFVANASDHVDVNAFNVGNGPFADDAYRDDTGHANAFEVHWDGTTLTQKDIQLSYKANPNTSDDPIDISFKKLVDVLISNGTINLNDIVST